MMRTANMLADRMVNRFVPKAPARMPVPTAGMCGPFTCVCSSNCGCANPNDGVGQIHCPDGVHTFCTSSC